MATEPVSNLKFEIGHVLFIDLVGYSKLLSEEQKERLRQLNDIVLATSQVVASTNEQLVRLPTGDGMALVFRNSAEEPAQCALEIAQALKEVLGGRRFLSAPLSEWAINALLTKPANDADPLQSLTQRERMVVQLAAEGMSNTEIAEKLFISPRTAETHRTNLLRKLGLQSQTDLVRFAIRKGMIQA